MRQHALDQYRTVDGLMKQLIVEIKAVITNYSRRNNAC